MKKLIIFILIVFIAALSAVGCNTTTVSNTKNSKEMNISEVIKYKDSYVGDNSAVLNITFKMPGGQFVKKTSLKTDKVPYEINVDYGLPKDSRLEEKDLIEYWNNEKTIKKIFLNNATSFFVLIKNVDIVNLSLDSLSKASISIKREEIEGFYGKDLRLFAKNPELWQKDVLGTVINSEEKI